MSYISPHYPLTIFNEANLNQIVDTCLATSDPCILLQQIQGTYDVLYGLDFLVPFANRDFGMGRVLALAFQRRLDYFLNGG
jgi:hypothetical protein